MGSVLDLGSVATAQVDHASEVFGDIYDISAQFALFAADRASIGKRVSFWDLLDFHKALEELWFSCLLHSTIKAPEASFIV